MSALSDYLENKILDHVLRGVSYTAPASTYVGLLTAAPSDSGGGTEVSGGNYARVGVTSGSGGWNNSQNSGTGASSGTDGTIENAATISFPSPSAGWGTVTHFGVYDAASAGNLLFYAALTTSKTINSGDTVSFAAGALTFQIDN